MLLRGVFLGVFPGKDYNQQNVEITEIPTSNLWLKDPGPDKQEIDRNQAGLLLCHWQ